MRSTRAHIRNNIVGYVALFLTLSTGAYAAGLANDSVRSKHIVNGQVKTADVADDSLTASDLGADSVGMSELANSAVGGAEIVNEQVGAADIATDGVGPSEITTDGVGKPEIATNTIGSEELLAINEVVNTQLVASEEYLTVTATCPAGQQILTGGFSSLNAGEVFPQFSRRAPGAWEVRYYNGYVSAAAWVSTYAYCLSP